MTDVMAGFDAGASGRAKNRASLIDRLTPSAFLEALEAEQDRWFLWVPVFLGAGIVGYFQLPTEPQLLLALAPLPIALVLSMLWRRGSLAVIVTGALLSATTGFALAKMRTDYVRAPVLDRPRRSARIHRTRRAATRARAADHIAAGLVRGAFESADAPSHSRSYDGSHCGVEAG